MLRSAKIAKLKYVIRRAMEGQRLFECDNFQLHCPVLAAANVNLETVANHMSVTPDDAEASQHIPKPQSPT